MTSPGSRPRGPARHELPEIDEAALAAARAADHALAAARAGGSARWTDFLAPLPDRLRDGDLPDVAAAARRARAAFGPKGSIRDDLPASVTEPLVEAVDRLLRFLARRSAHRD